MHVGFEKYNNRASRCAHPQMQSPDFPAVFQQSLLVRFCSRPRRRSCRNLHCKHGTRDLCEGRPDTRAWRDSVRTVQNERRSVQSPNMDGRPELPRRETESRFLLVLRNSNNAYTDNQSVNLRSPSRGPLRRPLLRAELSLRLQWEEEQSEMLKFSSIKLKCGSPNCASTKFGHRISATDDTARRPYHRRIRSVSCPPAGATPPTALTLASWLRSREGKSRPRRAATSVFCKPDRSLVRLRFCASGISPLN
jgi:hypothetical protein